MQAVANEAKREATVVASALDVQDNARIELDHVTKRFLTPNGEAFTAIRDVNLVVEPGQFCAVVGPTGCGKSTTLTLVSGLDRPSAGEVRVGGKVVEGMNVVDSLYSGYGEGAPRGQGPEQGRILAEGNAYLTKEFPKLDYIKKATIEK